MQPMGHVEFHCAVVEDSTRCARRHLEPYLDHQERMNLEGAGFLCEEHQEKYAWGVRVHGHVDETGDLAEKLLNDPIGMRTGDFRTSGSGENILVGDKQKSIGTKGSNTVNEWVPHQYFPEYNDWLMIRKDATSKKIIVPGFAMPPKKEDPFDGGF